MRHHLSSKEYYDEAAALNATPVYARLAIFITQQQPQLLHLVRASPAQPMMPQCSNLTNPCVTPHPSLLGHRPVWQFPAAGMLTSLDH